MLARRVGVDARWRRAGSWRGSLVVAMLIGVLLALGSSPARATHFRYGHLQWEEIGENRVQFTLSIAYRRSFFFGPNVGSIIGGVRTGTVISPTGDVQAGFFPGDGAQRAFNTPVIEINTSEDWLIARVVFEHQYPNSGPFTVQWQDTAWIELPIHVNNPLESCLFSKACG